MADAESTNPYQSPTTCDRPPALPAPDDRCGHWIGNTIAFYLVGFTYFALFACACPAVHSIQLPGVIVPLAWSTWTIFAAQTFREGAIAAVNGLLMAGWTFLLFVPVVSRWFVM